MQRLICSLVTVVSLYVPSSALAQYYNNWQQNQSGGDTVIYDGRVLINNLPPDTNTCDWVRRAARLPCEYFRDEPNSTGYTTHYVGRPRPRLNNQNIHQGQNPGWNNNSGWYTQPWNGEGGGGCIYKDRNLFIRIPC